MNKLKYSAMKTSKFAIYDTLKDKSLKITKVYLSLHRVIELIMDKYCRNNLEKRTIFECDQTWVNDSEILMEYELWKRKFI